MKGKNHSTFEHAGIPFHSLLERKYYIEQIEPELDKTIFLCEYEKPFPLIPPFEKMGRKIQGMTYYPDFYLTFMNGETLAVEVKGWMQEDARDRIKIFEYTYQGIRLNIVTHSTKYGGWISYDEYMKRRRADKRARLANGDTRPRGRRKRGQAHT